jgi:predicted nucleic acid-binding protein
MKIYVETSIPSFYFDTRKYAKIKARREWTCEWWGKQRRVESRIISYAVLAELDRTPSPKRESALALVKDMPVLESEEAVEETVRFYLQHRLMPQGAFGDAVHLALASLHKCDFLVTWNCKHLANANKLDHIKRINGLIGLTTPQLVTPLELLGNLYE